MHKSDVMDHYTIKLLYASNTQDLLDASEGVDQAQCYLTIRWDGFSNVIM